MKVTIIVAIDNRGAMGYENKLLCHLPNDLKRFKELTLGKTIIMGRKTFESLPKGALPGRRNIVLSRDLLYKKTNGHADICVHDSLGSAILSCNTLEHVFIVGGTRVYEAALWIASELLITHINHEFPMADTFFYGAFPLHLWKEVSRESHKKDDKHPYDYDFVTYVKRQENEITWKSLPKMDPHELMNVPNPYDSEGDFKD